MHLQLLFRHLRVQEVNKLFRQVLYLYSNLIGQSVTTCYLILQVINITRNTDVILKAFQLAIHVK